jgi:hypothetical protein
MQMIGPQWSCRRGPGEIVTRYWILSSGKAMRLTSIKPFQGNMDPASYKDDGRLRKIDFDVADISTKASFSAFAIGFHSDTAQQSAT